MLAVISAWVLHYPALVGVVEADLGFAYSIATEWVGGQGKQQFALLTPLGKQSLEGVKLESQARFLIGRDSSPSQ